MSTTQKAAPAKPGGFRDGRIPPFSYVTHAALAALHDEFEGAERSSAMSMYLALAVMSSEARARGNHGEFDATYGEIAACAGLSDKTVQRCVPRFEQAGLLAMEHRRGRASGWLLVDPNTVENQTPGPDPRTSSPVRTGHHVQPDRTSSPAAPDTMSGLNARAGSGGEEKNEEPPQPPEGEPPPVAELRRPVGQRKRDWQRYREQLEEQAGACSLKTGSAPMPAEAEWARLSPEVREVLGAENFDLWLSGAHAHAGEHDELLLAVPETVNGWIRDRFGPALNQVAGRRLEIVVCEETR